jgi:NAD-dependent SIR2 family protein deacetylase
MQGSMVEVKCERCSLAMKTLDYLKENGAHQVCDTCIQYLEDEKQAKLLSA